MTAPASTITIDESEHSTVVTCALHAWYSEGADDRRDAQRKAARHEGSHHELLDNRHRRAELERERRSGTRAVRKYRGVKRAKA